jgi:ferrous iron transport protein A
MFIKLSEMKVGSSGIVRSFENSTTSIKLMEMGCVPGEIISIEKIAPLKDPISVLVAGYSLSLRLEEAENIIIEEVI